MPVNIGDRVGAIQSANSETVRFFGYGVYVGDEPCPALCDIPNPKIELDDGGVVWGCQCWWGSEEQVKKMIAERPIVIVKIEQEA